MTIFDWSGERDTIMSPFDSIRYYKHFKGFDDVYGTFNWSCESMVGGFNYKHFQYDQVKQGEDKLGLLLNPFCMLQRLTS